MIMLYDCYILSIYINKLEWQTINIYIYIYIQWMSLSKIYFLIRSLDKNFFKKTNRYIKCKCEVDIIVISLILFIILNFIFIFCGFQKCPDSQRID